MRNSDKSIIRNIIGRLHVSEPLHVAGRTIGKALNKGLPRLYIANAIRYGRNVHIDNRNLFTNMGF